MYPMHFFLTKISIWRYVNSQNKKLSFQDIDEIYLILYSLFTRNSFTHQTVSGHGRNKSQQSSNTMKAYANGSIFRQYFFDMTYFHLLLGLRSRSTKS